MSKAKKLPSGNWRVRVFGGNDETGKPIYKSFTSPDKKVAEFEAAEYKLKHKKLSKAENLMFDTAADQYIANKENLLSPSTIRGYRIMQRNSFPLLKNSKLSDLAENDMIQKQMNENGKKYSAKSLANQFGFITAVMGFFKYPIEPVTLKQKQDKFLPVPTKKDSEKIMAILKDSPDIECQVLLALTCSLRQSEIAAIMVQDVNGSQIRIHAAMVPNENNELVYSPRNKSKAGTRTIDMPPYLSTKIAELCKEKGEGFLFDTKPGMVLKRFKKLLRDNKMPGYTIHSLRHCFAATLHAQNVPDKYVMQMGGWASDYVLKKVYQYTFDDETSKVKQKANTYFENILESKYDTKNDTN